MKFSPRKGNKNILNFATVLQLLGAFPKIKTDKSPQPENCAQRHRQNNAVGRYNFDK